MFKLVENSENVAEISQLLLNDKLNQINLGVIAESSG